MCWFSTEYANHVADANAGERLGIKKMYGHNSWVVSECEIEARRPTPVCLLDGTKVLFRFSEGQEQWCQVGAEAEAVFRTLKQPQAAVPVASPATCVEFESETDCVVCAATQSLSRR